MVYIPPLPEYLIPVLGATALPKSLGHTLLCEITLRLNLKSKWSMSLACPVTPIYRDADWKLENRGHYQEASTRCH